MYIYYVIINMYAYTYAIVNKTDSLKMLINTSKQLIHLGLVIMLMVTN